MRSKVCKRIMDVSEAPLAPLTLPTLSNLPDRNRKAAWIKSEDLIILSAVRRFGSQWPRIAELLPGRSDDAVRNRWHRLQKLEPADGDDGTRDRVRDLSAAIEQEILELPLSTPTTSDYSRSLWTAEEDNIIEEGVKRYGAKWRQIAEMLPGRSDSSARNRCVLLPPCPRPAACEPFTTYTAPPSPPSPPYMIGMIDGLCRLAPQMAAHSEGPA